jgi:hypothetical protein
MLNPAHHQPMEESSHPATSKVAPVPKMGGLATAETTLAIFTEGELDNIGSTALSGDFIMGCFSI